MKKKNKLYFGIPSPQNELSRNVYLFDASCERPDFVGNDIDYVNGVLFGASCERPDFVGKYIDYVNGLLFDASCERPDFFGKLEVKVMGMRVAAGICGRRMATRKRRSC